MSVCVVALVKGSDNEWRMGWNNGEDVPERITDHEQRNVLFVCVSQNLVTLRLNHVSICQDEFLPVKSFLHPYNHSSALMFVSPDRELKLARRSFCTIKILV